MKNTVILIDANVILDYVLVRQPQYKKICNRKGCNAV